MAELVGVHFRNAGKVLFLAKNNVFVHINDKVIAETQHGVEMGIVRTLPKEMDEKKANPDGFKILRMASNDDIEKNRQNLKEEDEAYKICYKKIHEHELEMKLVEAQYTFDKKKLTFYFLADGRVDFRALVKDLAATFHTRIELRQIGVRDETKIVGGIGICGRELCCATFLNGFAPVSIKMAKEQNMSLNPTKISGLCGRLMCCLKNEEEAYEELNKRLPRRGDEVETPDGKTGEVQSVDILREKVRVYSENGDSREVKEYHASELKYDPAVHKKVKHNKASNNEEQKNSKDTNDTKEVENRNLKETKPSKTLEDTIKEEYKDEINASEFQEELKEAEKEYKNGPRKHRSDFKPKKKNFDKKKNTNGEKKNFSKKKFNGKKNNKKSNNRKNFDNKNKNK
ncbi:MAG: stage 0 sporulation family protein [Lachnospiraceae bacterium]|nr:stage 0 sporulation family protein [Lachnospiraceae bacterium]